ncbi:hypothetical protein K432DRAFT_358638 [Lepidopterella palustris CBS 459.81]|uniref:Mediator of RNA polymerase II transcription subunit 18 n=1 Tax=Lepidopterella palustris CBS 459.81 TaxID=1314670 RepID=A0A8E2E536_9PEZI|nr:hypothetical protein K432DRAFT_358638 [Lepidopterella palustris CBS 459.81]
MHELLLFGQVPRSRHDQVLKILAGVAAMQPQRVIERHIVYKPQREPEEPGSNLRRGGSQGIVQKQTKQNAAKDLYFTQTVQSLAEGNFKSEQNSSVQKPNLKVEGNDSGNKWTFQFHDVPDTGDRGVTVRMTSSTDIVEGDPHAYMVAFGNNYVSEYYLEGHRFVNQNVVILLHRILQEPGPRPIQTSPQKSLPTFNSLKPLDPSGGYVLQASILVQDLGKPAILDQGVEELKRFKDLMKGCVELDVPDRLLLDTRVKYQANPFGVQR